LKILWATNTLPPEKGGSVFSGTLLQTGMEKKYKVEIAALIML
jgi:hypothetical protein